MEVTYNPYVAVQMKIRKALEDMHNGITDHKPFSIGGVEQRMSKWAKANNVNIGSQSLYMSVFSIQHANRNEKQIAGIAVSERDMIEFPVRRYGMELYYDNGVNPTDPKRFIYVDKERRTKFAIDPAYKVKMFKGERTKVVAFITADKMDDNEIIAPSKRYIKI